MLYLSFNFEIFVAVAHVPIASTLVLVDLMHAGAEVGYVRRNVQKKLKSEPSVRQTVEKKYFLKIHPLTTAYRIRRHF